MTASTYEYRLLELSEQYPELIALTAENRAALRNLPNLAPERFVDFGIAEQTMVGAAAGMALRGRRPFVHALTTFLTMRAYEFIRTDVGIPQLPVTLVGYVPGFLSTANGPTHQAIEDIALMRTVSGMQIVCPADNAELLACLPHILASARPTYVRFYDGAPKVAHDFERQPYALGRAETLVDDGGVATLLTFGFLTEHVVLAAEKLRAAGKPVRVLNMRTIAPIDRQAIKLAAQQSELLVTIEDHLGFGGLRAAVQDVLASERLLTRLESIALDGYFVPALLPDVLRVERFDADGLTSRVLALVEG